MNNCSHKPASLLDLVRQRSSCRSYRDRPVPAEHVEAMLEAARLAPSACNRQPWRFAVVTAPEMRHRLVNEAFLPGIDMQWASAAPVLVVLGLERSLVTHRLAPSVSGIDYPLLDLGIAGEHLVLQATELGLGTCWIGWIRPGIARRLVGWRRTVRVVAIISVGWPAGPSRPRPRRPLAELTTYLQ